MAQATLNSESNRDYAIRLSAYYSWEAAGSPTGYEVDFWLRATQTVTPSFPLRTQQILPVGFGYEGGVSAQPPVIEINSMTTGA